MRRESREWLAGTAVIVLGACVTISLYIGITSYGDMVYRAFMYLLAAVALVFGFLIVGIAFPLSVGEIVLTWLEGEEDKDAKNEDPPFQF